MPSPPSPPSQHGGAVDPEGAAATGAAGAGGGGSSAGQQQQAATPAAAADRAPILLVVPSRHVKRVHLVRHAEGFHNVAGAIDYANYKLERYFDAHLTREGWRQAHTLRAELLSAAGQESAAVRPAIVLVSPLARALETAAAVFGGALLIGGEGGDEDDHHPHPLVMRAQSAEPGVREAHPPISAVGHGAVAVVPVPPFAAVELAREVSGLHPCDRRRALSGKRAAFPGVDFDAHPSPDEDPLWQPEARECDADVRERALALLRLVASGRGEDEVAVVSHASLLRHLLSATARDEKTRLPFKNAELRTVMLVVSP